MRVVGSKIGIPKRGSGDARGGALEDSGFTLWEELCSAKVG